MEEVKTKDIYLTKKNKMIKYFKFSTYRMTFLSLSIALNLLLAVFDNYILGIVPLFNFLVIELTFFTYLIVFYTINEIYAILMIFICSWIRMLLFPSTGAWVGVLSLNLSDLFEFVIFIPFYYLFEKLIKIENYTRKKFIVIALSLVLATILNSCLDVFWNYTFLVKLYSIVYGSSINSLINNNWAVYLGSNYAFNLLKYTINTGLFLGTLNLLIVLNKKY